MKFRKNPIIIDAVQWYDHEHSNPTCPRDWVVVRNFLHQELKDSSVCGYCNPLMSDHGWIDTLEGGHIVCPADWIIKGINGEYYPCKPDIFRQTYEPVEDENG